MQPQFRRALKASGGGGGLPVTNLIANWVGDDYVSGTWSDASGNGTTVTTSPGMTSPGIGSSLNGHATVSFNGTNTSLTGPISISGNTFSVFAVATLSSFSGTLYKRLISFQDAPSDDYNNPASAVPFLEQAGSSSIQAIRNGSFLSGFTVTAGVPFLGTSIFDGTDATLYLNGVAGTSDPSSGSFSISKVWIGSPNYNDSFWDGEIAEIAVYSSINPIDKATAESYLRTKYGL